MATGGTIPSSKTQTVTFFNTTGVIEKDKNIYLAFTRRFRTSHPLWLSLNTHIHTLLTYQKVVGLLSKSVLALSLTLSLS